jgi:hypothetical protein
MNKDNYNIRILDVISVINKKISFLAELFYNNVGSCEHGNEPFGLQDP